MQWFKPWGWIYRPVTIIGWVITILAIIFCVQVFMAVDRHSHSNSDTLYGIFPFIVPAFLVWLWIGYKASNLDKK